MNLQSSSSSTTLPSGRVGWDGCDILDSANSEAGSGESSQGDLAAWPWGLGANTAPASHFDVDRVDSDDLQLLGDVGGSEHGCVGR
mmetsp:Transcript_58874/g.108736  ORF Transcript_58874/g.108736 Transcript_58874/m.108736 type:complete len:86 (+) Transcript_58874:34-291(+)